MFNLAIFLLPQSIATIIAGIIPTLWIAYTYFKNRFKAFTDNKNQFILNHIIIPFYEPIELSLFKPITKDNKDVMLTRLELLINHLRKEQLFFFLPIKLTTILLSIEKEAILTNQCSITKLNNDYQKFSRFYFQLSWEIRKHSNIELFEYDYRKSLAPLYVGDRLRYSFEPENIFRNTVAASFITTYFTVLIYHFLKPTSFSLSQAIVTVWGICVILYLSYILLLVIIWIIQKCINWLNGVTKPD